jgi:hypothetical protein
MTAPRKPEPLTEEELASLVLDYCDGLEQSALDGMTRLFATLDAARERIAAVERERDEARERVDALEEAVHDELPEVTGDADGTLETGEVCRIETVGMLYKELTVERDALRAEVEAWRKADDVDTDASCSAFPWKDKARELRAQNEGAKRG